MRLIPRRSDQVHVCIWRTGKESDAARNTFQTALNNQAHRKIKIPVVFKIFFLLNPCLGWDYLFDCLSLQPVCPFDLMWATSAHTAMQRGEVERDVSVRVGSPVLHVCNWTPSTKWRESKEYFYWCFFFPNCKGSDLSVSPYKTSFEPSFFLQVPLIPATHPAAFPPSVCNIHLGERCRDETHILMLTRTLPRALFTTSVTYHQIKSGWWRQKEGPRIYMFYPAENHKIIAAVSKHSGTASMCWLTSLDTLVLCLVADVFASLCMRVREGVRAWRFQPWSADLLATLGQVISVIAAKAARRTNERVKRRQGASTCIYLQASRQEEQHKAGIAASIL